MRFVDYNYIALTETDFLVHESRSPMGEISGMFNNDLARLCTSSKKRATLVPGMKLEFETFCCYDSEATAVLIDNLFLNSVPTFLDFNSDNSWTCGTYRTEAIQPTYSSMGSNQMRIPGIAYPPALRRGSGCSVGNSVNFFSGLKVRVFPKPKVVSAS